MRILLISLLLSITFTACNESTFSGVGTTAKSRQESKGKPKLESKALEQKSDIRLESEAVVAASGKKISESFNGSIAASPGKVDIVFAVDTSGSMETEKTFLEQNMGDFLQKFKNASDLDYRIYLMGEGFNFPAIKDERFIIINKPIGSTDAIYRFQDFLKGKLDPLMDKMKPYRIDSTKELVVISDDDSSKSADKFSEFVETNRLGTVHMNGLVGVEDSQENEWCSIIREGEQYSTLSDSKEHKGLIQDLCIEDWSLLLENLANEIIDKNARLNYVLQKAKVDLSKKVMVSIDGEVLVEREHYIVDPHRNSILFNKKSAPGPGTDIKVEYTSL